MRGIPIFVLQVEQKSRKDHIKVRVTVNAALLEGYAAYPNLVSCSIYDTKPVHYLSMVCDTLKWVVMEKPWSPEHNYLGLRITVFRCYVLPTPTVGQPDIFLHNPPFFSTPLQLYLSTSLLTRRSLYWYPASKRMFSPLDISTQPQLGHGKPNKDVYFTQWSEWLVKINPGYRMISLCIQTNPQLIIPGPNFT